MPDPIGLTALDSLTIQYCDKLKGFCKTCAISYAEEDTLPYEEEDTSPYEDEDTLSALPRGLGSWGRLSSSHLPGWMSCRRCRIQSG
jgi:hypothetical protein